MMINNLNTFNKLNHTSKIFDNFKVFVGGQGVRLIFWPLDQQKQFAEFLLVVLVRKITSAADSIKLKVSALCNAILDMGTRNNPVILAGWVRPLKKLFVLWLIARARDQKQAPQNFLMMINNNNVLKEDK